MKNLSMTGLRILNAIHIFFGKRSKPYDPSLQARFTVEDAAAGASVLLTLLEEPEEPMDCIE